MADLGSDTLVAARTWSAAFDSYDEARHRLLPRHVGGSHGTSFIVAIDDRVAGKDLHQGAWPAAQA